MKYIKLRNPDPACWIKQCKQEAATSSSDGDYLSLQKARKSYLQELPEELLEQIIQDVSFGGLRLLLHSGSSKLCRLARIRLQALHKELQMRPGGLEKTKFFGQLPLEQPWPSIETIGKQFLGKELISANSRYRDEFSFTIFDLPSNHEIRREYTIKEIDWRPPPLWGRWSGNKLLVFLRQGICWRVRWTA